jgi:hypothetical protein
VHRAGDVASAADPFALEGQRRQGIVVVARRTLTRLAAGEARDVNEKPP